MQQRQRPEIPDSPAATQLLRDLDDALEKLQERLALHRSSEHKFALIHLVEGMSIETWKEIADLLHSQNWLALPLDDDDGVQFSHIRATLEELIHQRDHDTLTGLANRRLFDRQLTLEMQRAQRTDMPLSLVMLDIDNFKVINDTYGHPTGDKVLVALGDLLSRSRRVYDVAARVGGEEFCLLLPGATPMQAQDIATRVLQDFREMPFEMPEGGTFHATFSAGVASSCGGPTPNTPEALFAKADALLYEAKGKGRNCIETMISRHKISENPALVHAAEKQFLFTGKEIQ